MPRRGGDWPRVRDMVARNHRLLVFTSARWKQAAEGIAYQWDYMVENQYGDGGMESGVCYNRSESAALDDLTRSLVLVNYFHTIPLGATACLEHSRGLVGMLRTCHDAAGDRWANFVAVDYYSVLALVLDLFAGTCEWPNESSSIRSGLQALFAAVNVNHQPRVCLGCLIGRREATAVECSRPRACSTGCSSAAATTSALAGNEP